jgi:hypothetical protein
MAEENKMTQGHRALTDFALGSSDTGFPDRARAMAVDAITDCIACMIAGAGEPLAAKMRDCGKGALDAAVADEIFGLAQALDEAPDLDPLIGALSRGFDGDRREAAAE